MSENHEGRLPKTAERTREELEQDIVYLTARLRLSEARNAGHAKDYRRFADLMARLFPVNSKRSSSLSDVCSLVAFLEKQVEVGNKRLQGKFWERVRENAGDLIVCGADALPLTRVTNELKLIWDGVKRDYLA